MRFTEVNHISVATSDLDRSAKFYRDVLGLRPITRPPFRSVGMWLDSGSIQIHLTVNPNGTYRRDRLIDTTDSHFALRVEDFEEAMRHLFACGFKEDSVANDPKRLLIDRKSAAGYPQAYLLDPDQHLIEINAAN